MVQKSVSAEVTTSTTKVAVSAEQNSAGQVIPITVKTVNIRISRGRIGGAMSLKVGDATWVVLDEEQGLSLPIDLSTTTVLLRKASPFAGAIDATVEYQTVDYYLLDGQSVPLQFGTEGGVTVQPVRNSNFTLVAADSGTIIPVSGAVVVTAAADSNLTAPVEVQRVNAGALSGVAGAGATLFNPLTNAAWGTLQVNNKLASLVFSPGTQPGEYSAGKIGA